MDLPSYFVSPKGSIVSTWSSFCSVCHSICSFIIFLAVYLEGIIFFQGPIVIFGRFTPLKATRYPLLMVCCRANFTFTLFYFNV